MSNSGPYRGQQRRRLAAKSAKHGAAGWVSIRHMVRPLFVAFAALVAPVFLRAAPPDESEFFEKSIRPVLAEHCYECHGPEKQKAELRLDSRAAVLKGGDLGAVVIPGKPEESSLIKSVRHEGDSKMPEKGEKLSDEQIAALTHWVKIGLPWPEHDGPKLSSQEQAARTHWAYQPIRSPQPPSSEKDSNPIDAFVHAKLAGTPFQAAPRASARALIRRATFDLTGLPPTAEELEAFVSESSDPSKSAAAYERLIDRLLASPRYGERWGRYWLDIARYADTKGYVFQEERRYPFAYTYRDWVIRAFNDDMPYDQFLVRQIAADHLGEGNSHLAAMGFLTLGRRFINNIHDIIDDRIDVLSRGTMALTTTCARCHDHKFDPITQKDYYALYGVFASSDEPGPGDQPLLDGARANDPDYLREKAKREAPIQELYAARGRDLNWLMLHLTGTPWLVPNSTVESLFESRFFTRKAKDELRDLRNKLVAVEISPNAPPRAPVLVDKPQPVTPRVFIRGKPDRPGEEVPRRFISVLAGGKPEPWTKGSGRLELGRAIASKENPLTARVFVNRVWAHHFGAGLVRTPGDFGVKGEPPTHPELLDWLASRFIEQGWSVKKLHRLIMLSATYQQSSDGSPEARETDPENRLLTHMNRRRLDFESTRDSLLKVAGQLDESIGGRAVEITTQPFAKRRSVYAFIDRQNLPGVFRTFDFASPDATSPQRHVTTVPQQALFMLNNPFVIEQARALVAKPEFQTTELSESQIQQLYRRIFSRPAEPAEVEASRQYLAAQLAQPPPSPDSPVWQYGYGGYDAATRKTSFTPLPHWTKYAWQGGPELPDKKLGWVLLNAHGGHTGRDAKHAAIRRWTAPRDAVVEIDSTLKRPEPQGDGVLARIVSSRSGELLQAVAAPGAVAEMKLARVEVKRGDAIDFIVECRADETSDSFHWAPMIRTSGTDWNATTGFGGTRPSPVTRLTAWEKYAQALLAANEFVFVD